MAALYEGYTLCGLFQAPNRFESGIQGVEVEKDSDHVIVTDSTRSVTLYKISDQKPLGSWTVKQGQSLTCPAVYNRLTQEYVVVSDKKVIRVWKKDDVILEKAFKASVSAEVWRVHSTPGGELVVLFLRGAIRLLESLLASPQQPIEEVLAPEENIRWSADFLAETKQFVVFTTEKREEQFVYLQRMNPNILQKYRLEADGSGLSPLSFSVTCTDKSITLLYLYPNGQVYHSLLSVCGEMEPSTQLLPLPCSLLLRLPVGEGLLCDASAHTLDNTHVAVVGVPHPSAGAGKDFLCIWNTNFHTLQAGKEMAGKVYGQLWSYSNKLFIPHGKALSVIPFECHRSSLASALGKLKQTVSEGSNSLLVSSWTQSSRTTETKMSKMGCNSQSVPDMTFYKVLELIKTAPVEEVCREVEGFISRANMQDLQPCMGQLASSLVSRSLAESTFYTPGLLTKLLNTQCLCYSVCPDLLLLVLEKEDYFLCQLCLQLFPDVPEAVTYACLKVFISVSDSDADKVNLEPISMSFMEKLVDGDVQAASQNGFSSAIPPSEEDCSDAPVGGGSSMTGTEDKTSYWPLVCPVGLHKAVLLNEVLQTGYGDTSLLAHLKDLSAQQVILFLKYLQFLYMKYSQDSLRTMQGMRSPTITQIMDWVCLLLDAHFTVLVMTPEAKGLLLNLHSIIKAQVRLFSELGKIGSRLKELQKMNMTKEVGQYSVEIIELF